ncbi:MAG: glycoside hydrolase family 5 protein [Clostridiales bacterium]|nr:glycoside hydrolase family 5 protein [Clostridiales bacterium]
MKILYGYMAGANLGHWISQYGNRDENHWDNYIQETDIARMKSWGLDHIRLPVDYFIFEKDESPGVYLDKGLAYIDKTILWCKKYSMNMVLDLHHAPGYFFGDGNKNLLFTDLASQKRFLDIWKMFAERYKNEGDNLIFELLNELVWSDSSSWNELWQKAVECILKISPQRRIIVGGNNYNSINELKNLTVSENDRVLYTFHFYEPFLFTHQRAPWVENNRRWQKSVTYPYNPEDHLEYYGGRLPDSYKGRKLIDKNFIESYMSPAFEFSEKYGKTLYCGEYGVISNADDESAVRWLSDMADVLLNHGIGRAVWSYRGFSSITSNDNQSFNPKMVEAISRK